MSAPSPYKGLCPRLLVVPVATLVLGTLVPGLLAWHLLENSARSQDRERAVSLLCAVDAERNRADDAMAAKPPLTQPGGQPTGSHAAYDLVRRYLGTPGASPIRYHLAVLNPADPSDRADDWEASAIATLSTDRRLQTMDSERVIGGQRYLVVAAPVTVRSTACLRCHSTPQAAPAWRVRQYGQTGGFSWHEGQVVGASVLMVPSDPRSAASAVFWPVAYIMGLLVVVCLVGLVWRTWTMVARPADELLAASQAIRRGEWTTKMRCHGSDEMSQLAISFQDTTRWLRDRVVTEEKLRAMFQQFIPASVAARALGKDADRILGGTRHHVTVMCINVRNFRLLQDNLKPDETISTLNEVFAAVNKVIVANRGMVSKYLGDTVLAFFGMPLGNDDHTKCAVTAALEIPRALQSLYLRLDEDHGWELGVGIGIASGEALVGHFGSSEHMEYTVLGDVVLQAHRLEGITRTVPEEDTICVSEEMYRTLMSDIHVYDLGDRSGSDGKSIHAYVVQGFRSEARAALAA